MTETIEMPENGTQAAPAPPALPPLEERPLVTFAVFAYNQEDYIREAVEGAFSQTYEPLEIILSDDCSTDRTFEIMQEMAAAYEGPHDVRVRKTRINRGTFNHVLEVSKICSGSLLILSAGDDVSYPERSCIISERWINSRASGISSLCELVDEQLNTVEDRCIRLCGKEVNSWFIGLKDLPPFCVGATTAYTVSFLRNLPESPEPIYSEDSLLYFLLCATNQKIEVIYDPLVKYRKNQRSWSNNSSVKNNSTSSIMEFEEKLSAASKGYINSFRYVKDFLSVSEIKIDKNIINRIRKSEEFHRIRCELPNSRPLSRFQLLFRCKEWRSFRYLAPRLIGLRLFVVVKAHMIRLFARP